MRLDGGLQPPSPNVTPPQRYVCPHPKCDTPPKDVSPPSPLTEGGFSSSFFGSGAGRESGSFLLSFLHERGGVCVKRQGGSPGGSAPPF